jgi:ppGpp synthetase/RelA/SpoT-type nucleotidyltranferase
LQSKHSENTMSLNISLIGNCARMRLATIKLLKIIFFCVPGCFFIPAQAHLSCQNLFEKSDLKKKSEAANKGISDSMQMPITPDLVYFDPTRNEWQVLALNPDGIFELIKFNHKEFNNYVAKTSSHEMRVISELIEHAIKKFDRVVKNFGKIADAFNAKQSARLKEKSSLINKIFQRYTLYKNRGDNYSLKHINDLIGIRWTLPSKNNLLVVQPSSGSQQASGRYIQRSKQEWAKILGVRSRNILEIVEKGQSPEELLAGKFYRATHLIIQYDFNLRIEIQIKTELMSLWDSWEHDLIYKPQTNDPTQLSKIKIYTQRWAQMIRLIEDSPYPILKVRELLDKNNISIKTDDAPLELLDKQWREELQIDEKKSFYYSRESALNETLGLHH